MEYKASNIARAERALDANFFATLENLGNTPSFSALQLIVMAGGLTEDEADKMIDELGIEKTLSKAVEALGEAGFLAKMAAAVKESQPTSKAIGAKTKD